MHATYGNDDPVLLWHNGKLHLFFVGVVGSRRKAESVKVLYAILGDDLQPITIHSPAYGPPGQPQKNWAPFSHDGELLAVYSIAPHQIIRIDGDCAELEHESPTVGRWTGGHMRGGAAPVRVGDEYWHFFHGRLDPQRHYSTGLCVFDAFPPFQIRRLTPEPIQWGDVETQPDDMHCPVVFVRGAIRRGDDWILSSGIHDRWTQLDRFEHDGLQQKLTRVMPPHWWTWRGEPQEQGMFVSIHVLDEYGVRGLDLRGGVVLDIGAHVGTFALLAKDRGAASVHCYEPSPKSFMALQANTARIGGIRVHQQAIGGKHGRGRLDAMSESTSDKVHSDTAGEVTIIPLDDAIRLAVADSPNGRLRLLKLDCEGGEWSSMPESRLLQLVDAVAGEYHLGALFGDWTPEKLRSLLIGVGFTSVVVTDPTSIGVGAFRASRLG
jgi:FkbM family methyltransferase